MKTKITISLDDDLLREIRGMAKREGASLNSLLTTYLQQIVDERKAYRLARKRAVARLRRGLDLGWIPGPRDELYRS